MLNQKNTHPDLDDEARENSRALERLINSKRFVDIRSDHIPTQRLEKGMPLRWGNETVTTAFPPHGNDSTSQAC
ncbi:MAG: hypothetical protein NT086_11120 [Proteobacteria bacterium]|nr:hypothetical protein [Pseudomonadota bacterium]